MHDYSTFIWKRLSIIRKNGYETMLIKIWWHCIRDRQIQNIELQDRGWKVLWGRGGIEKQWEMGSLSKWKIAAPYKVNSKWTGLKYEW